MAKEGIDLKKAAIFPLVHGVRSLALEQRLGRTNTLDRLWALSDAKVLDRPFASTLAETFAFLQDLRLSVRLGGGDPGQVRADKIAVLDRDADQPRAVTILVWWLACAVPFGEAAGGPGLWNQSRGDMRTTVLTRLLPHLVTQGLRAGLALGGAALVWFGAVGALEMFLTALLSWGVHLRATARQGWPRFDPGLVRPLLRDALPILGTAVLATLTMRLDQMMLAKFSTLEQVGFYAAATRFSEIWWTVPGIVMQVAGPLVLFGESDDARRNHRLAGLYAVLISAACVAAGATIVIGPWLVPQLLGARFDAAVPVLAIHVLTAIIVFADAPTVQELIRRGAQRILLWKGLVALGANAALNLWLIPHHGALGASIATVASYAAAVVFAPLFFPQVRDLARMQVRAPLWLLRHAFNRR